MLSKKHVYAKARAEFGSRWHLVPKATRKERLKLIRDSIRRDENKRYRETWKKTEAPKTEAKPEANPSDMFALLANAVQQQMGGRPLSWQECEAMNEAMYSMVDG